jgi:hypothetical protein
MRDCPSKRVFVIRDDDEYSSASDFDEDTLAFLQMTMKVMMTTLRSILVLVMQVTMRA